MSFTLDFLFGLVNGTLRALIRHLEEGLEALWNAFPNPVKMLDVAFNFITGIPGILVSAPFIAVETAFIRKLRQAKLHNRLMTLENAVHMAFDAHAEFVRNITFTDSSGIVGWLAGWIGRFLWTFGKRVKLILSLLGARTEAEVISVVLRALKSRLALIRVIAAVLAVILLIEWLGFLFWFIGLMLLFIEGSATKLLLFGNRPRLRRNKPGVQYRQGRGVTS